MGRSKALRKAGPRAARMATAARSMVVNARVRGSLGRTPKSKLDRERPRTSKPNRPARTPTRVSRMLWQTTRDTMRAGVAPRAKVRWAYFCARILTNERKARGNGCRFDTLGYAQQVQDFFVKQRRTLGSRVAGRREHIDGIENMVRLIPAVHG